MTFSENPLRLFRIMLQGRIIGRAGASSTGRAGSEAILATGSMGAQAGREAAVIPNWRSRLRPETAAPMTTSAIYGFPIRRQ
jgi:hypothetical protein